MCYPHNSPADSTSAMWQEPQTKVKQKSQNDLYVKSSV